MRISCICLVVVFLTIIPIQYLPVSHMLPMMPEAFARSPMSMLGLNPTSNWVSGQRISVNFLQDPYVNTRSNVDQLNDYDPNSASMPTMKIGTPFTLSGANATFFETGEIITNNGISSSLSFSNLQNLTDNSQDESISGRPIYTPNSTVTIHNTGGIMINLNTNMQTLKNTIHDSAVGNAEKFKGFNFLNLDLRSLGEYSEPSHSISSVNVYLAHWHNDQISLSTSLHSGQNIQLVSIANTTSLLDMINLDVASSNVANQTIVNQNIFEIPDYDRIGFVLQFNTGGGTIHFTVNKGLPIVDDFFSIGIIGDGKSYYQRINNAIYRYELKGTPMHPGVFSGTVQYALLNQENIFDPNIYTGLKSIGTDVKFAALQEMKDGYNNTPQINYLVHFLGTVYTLSTKQEILTHSGIAKFDMKNYTAGDTVKITLQDQDLNVDNDIIDIYTVVPPIGNLEHDSQDVAVDTVGVKNLGTNSDGISFGSLLEIAFGKNDTRWSNAVIPNDANHAKACKFATGVVNNGNGTDGGYSTSLSATGFSLVETGPSTGIFTGTFQFPDQFCQSGNIISTQNQDIKIKYYDFSDDSGDFAEKDSSLGGFGFVNTMKIVPQFSQFTTINHVTPSVSDSESFPAIIFYRNSSVVDLGISQLSHLGLTPRKTLDLLPSVAVTLTGYQLRQITDEYAVAIFRDIRAYVASTPCLSCSSLSANDHRINADAVHALGIKGGGVKIAILDTGIDNPLINVDRTNNCYDSVDSADHSCFDLIGHGTHVAGIAMANGGTTFVDTTGVAPNATPLDIKVIDVEGGIPIGSFSSVAEGMQHAISMGADVINISLESNENFDVVDCDLDSSTQDIVGSIYPYIYAAVSNGIPVVAASGNFGHVAAPACISKVIAVGAVDQSNSNNLWNESTTTGKSSANGPAMLEHGLVAPGVGIWSTYRCDLSDLNCTTPVMASGTGTSMATPVVTGTIALMIDKATSDGITLSPKSIARILFDTACTSTCLPVTTNAATNEFGHGMVDASAAVNEVGTFVQPRKTGTVITLSQNSIEAGMPVNISARVSDIDSGSASQPQGSIFFTNWPNPDPTRFSGYSCNHPSSNTLQCSVSYLQSDSNRVKFLAQYNGDINHDTSHDEKMLKVHTTTEISGLPSNPNQFSTIPFTVNVSFHGGSVHNGQIDLTDGGQGGTFGNNPCNVPCTTTYQPPSTPIATTTSPISVTITAQYTDPISHWFADSSGASSISVVPEFPAGISIITTLVFVIAILFARLGNPFNKINN